MARATARTGHDDRCRELTTRILVLAASTVAGTTVHDVAHANEQHLAAGPSRQSGPDNLAVDSADRVTAVLLATTPGVNDVAFSPDGKLLASAYADTVRI